MFLEKEGELRHDIKEIYINLKWAHKLEGVNFILCGLWS